jgi:uncharacterized protein with gpF-like domain
LSDEEVHERIETVAKAIAEGRGKSFAESEAQAVYGASQLRALQRAGYTTKFWVTMQDDRVRESHLECEEQGDIQLGKKFKNGLLYPGDPAGGPEEVMNCRCVLEGGSRKRGEDATA